MARVAAWTTQRDGYSPTWPPATGSRGGQYRRAAARHAQAGDGLKIDLGADFMIDGNKGLCRVQSGDFGQSQRGLLPGPALPPPAQSLYEGYLSHDPVLSRHAQTYSAKVDYALEDLSITSITSYRHLTAMTGANWKVPRSTCCNS
jgi:iron complex outermembrane receptor protein